MSVKGLSLLEAKEAAKSSKNSRATPSSDKPAADKSDDKGLKFEAQTPSYDLKTSHM
jgi:hypothetical protein